MNSLGTLSSSFQTDVTQDHAEITGMRGATGYEGGNSPTVAAPIVGPQPAESTIATPPPLPDPFALPKLALRVERLLKESRKVTVGEERLDEIAGELRSIVPGLCGEILSARRRAAEQTLRSLYHERYHRFAKMRTYTEFFREVVEARQQSAEFGHERDRGQLFSKAQQIVEIYRSECQNASIS